MGWQFPEYPEDWYDISAAVKRRDGYRCVDCGIRGVILHAHHIIPLSRGGSNDLSNLITVCEECHAAYHPHMQVNSRDDYRPKRFSHRHQYTNGDFFVLIDSIARIAVVFLDHLALFCVASAKILIQCCRFLFNGFMSIITPVVLWPLSVIDDIAEVDDREVGTMTILIKLLVIVGLVFMLFYSFITYLREWK